MADDHKQISRFLSLVLRHQPETIGIKLDEQGWAGVEQLIGQMNLHGQKLDRVLLEEVVRTSDKKRFALSTDGLRIRANQGHSVSVDLALPAVPPPEVLFHGTAERFVNSIRDTGLNAGERQHVHLSSDIATAMKVGSRHGKPVVLKISAVKMHESGHVFHLSDNGVWLTLSVPPQFIDFAGMAQV